MVSINDSHRRSLKGTEFAKDSQQWRDRQYRSASFGTGATEKLGKL